MDKLHVGLLCQLLYLYAFAQGWGNGRVETLNFITVVGLIGLFNYCVFKLKKLMESFLDLFRSAAPQSEEVSHHHEHRGLLMPPCHDIPNNLSQHLGPDKMLEFQFFETTFIILDRRDLLDGFRRAARVMVGNKIDWQLVFGEPISYSKVLRTKMPQLINGKKRQLSEEQLETIINLAREVRASRKLAIDRKRGCSDPSTVKRHEKALENWDKLISSIEEAWWEKPVSVLSSVALKLIAVVSGFILEGFRVMFSTIVGWIRSRIRC